MGFNSAFKGLNKPLRNPEITTTSLAYAFKPFKRAVARIYNLL